MSAPNIAYHNNGNAVISLHKVAVSKADCYPAINIYGSGDLKALFYLDGFLIFPQKQTDGTIIESFLGYVLEGGANIGMHNGARWSKTRVPLKMPDSSVKMAIVLNDAGLNTLGYAAQPTVISAQVGNIVIASQVFKSAYYDASTAYGWRLRNINSGSIRNPQAGLNIPEKSSVSAGYTGDPFAGDMYAAKKGDTILVSAYVNNPEGMFYSGEVQITLNARNVNLGYDAVYASYAKNGFSSPSVYYITRPFIGVPNDYQDNGYCEIYTDQACTIPAQIGYYSDGNKWYKVEHVSTPVSANVITEKGNAVPGQYPQGDPGNPPLYYTYNWLGYTANYASACSESSPRTTYKSTADDRHYKDTQLTQLADSGYYKTGGGTGGSGTRFIDIMNGYEGYGYTNCP